VVGVPSKQTTFFGRDAHADVVYRLSRRRRTTGQSTTRNSPRRWSAARLATNPSRRIRKPKLRNWQPRSGLPPDAARSFSAIPGSAALPRIDRSGSPTAASAIVPRHTPGVLPAPAVLWLPGPWLTTATVFSVVSPGRRLEPLPDPSRPRCASAAPGGSAPARPGRPAIIGQVGTHRGTAVTHDLRLGSVCLPSAVRSMGCAPRTRFFSSFFTGRSETANSCWRMWELCRPNRLPPRRRAASGSGSRR
jgi:hypothetical protein